MEDTFKSLFMDYLNLFINEQTSATSRCPARCSSTTSAHAAPLARRDTSELRELRGVPVAATAHVQRQISLVQRRGSPDRTAASIGDGTPTAPPTSTSPSTPSPPARSSSRRRQLHHRRRRRRRHRSRSRVVELPRAVLIRVVIDKVLFRALDGWKWLEKAGF
jgi:hypothetical protein